MPELSVVGLDLSLTCTGVATASGVLRIKSAGGKDDTLSQRASRLRKLAGEILRYAEWADLVVIEQPAYSQHKGSTHDRSGLWWLVVAGLMAQQVPVAEVAPTSLKRYATGKGNADKDTVLAESVHRFPLLGIRNNNEADAHWLRAMGCDQLGQALVDLPVHNRKSLAAVKWPEMRQAK